MASQLTSFDNPFSELSCTTDLYLDGAKQCPTWHLWVLSFNFLNL